LNRPGNPVLFGVWPPVGAGRIWLARSRL